MSCTTNITLDPVDGSGGSAMVSGDCSITLTATPNPGWSFDKWDFGTGITHDNPASFDFIDGTTFDVTAVFIEDTPTDFNLTTHVVGSGSIGLSPSGGTYVSGTVIALTATPSPGFFFNGWSGDLSGSTNPTNITMNADKDVTATFSETPPDPSGGIFQVYKRNTDNISTFIAEIPTTEILTHAVMEGQYIYAISSGSNNLTVIDVMASDDPVEISLTDIGFPLRNISHQGEQIYVCGDNQVAIINTTDPNAPTIEGTFS